MESKFSFYHRISKNNFLSKYCEQNPASLMQVYKWIRFKERKQTAVENVKA